MIGMRSSIQRWACVLPILKFSPSRMSLPGPRNHDVPAGSVDAKNVKKEPATSYLPT